MVNNYTNDPALIDGISLYANEAERLRHIEHILMIAREEKRSVTLITTWYEYVLAGLKPHASIPDYLGVFVSRRVIELLKK